MQDKIIFHHYQASPFAEKIRAMFGYSDLEWCSIESPVFPPRPNLDPLVGGYRRIPVMQIGADLFCDTKLIAREIANLSGKTEIDQFQCADDVIAFSNYCDSKVFFSIFSAASQAKLLIGLFLQLGLSGGVRFIKDRQGFMKSANIRVPKKKDAARLIDEFFARADSMLEGQDFLFGDQPCAADFCAYHPLWIRTEAFKNRVPKAYPNVARWYDAMRRFSAKPIERLDQSSVFKVAKESSPRTLDTSLSDELVGAQVSISPDDYAMDTVEGVLVGVYADRWVIARETPRFGTLHIHFPKQGYELKGA